MSKKMLIDMNSNTSEGDELRTRHDETNNKLFDSEDLHNKSTDNQIQRRSTRYHRHTPQQIQEMEAFFKECPLPNNKQRKELGSKLGMEPLQVKFWFQNKRTQMRAYHEHIENSHLRIENEKLRVENMRYKEALSNACCLTCGVKTVVSEMSSYEHHLRLENAQIRKEIDYIAAIAAKHVGKPLTGVETTPSLCPS